MRKWAFTSGFQFAEWRDEECGKCKRYVESSEPGTGCNIEEQVAMAYIAGNEIPVPDELSETGNYHPYTCGKQEVKEDV